MQNSYLIPANSKRGDLIFNIFRPIDLAVFLIGVGGTILLLMSLGTSESSGIIMILAPGLISALLIMPVPNQHNVLVFLGAILKFFTSQQRYRWKGWCMYDNFR